MGDNMPEAQVKGLCGLSFIAFICSKLFATSAAMFIAFHSFLFPGTRPGLLKSMAANVQNLHK
jgi:hypothetical protein